MTPSKRHWVRDKNLLHIFYSGRGNYQAWQVRIGNGQLVSCTFSWSVYGSKSKALEAAQKFRDSALPFVESWVKHYNGGISGLRNKTGVIGVSRESNNNDPVYVAQWVTSTGKHEVSIFSVRKWGEEKALALAKEAREKAVGAFPIEITKEIAKLKAEVRKEQLSLRRGETLVDPR